MNRRTHPSERAQQALCYLTPGRPASKDALLNLHVCRNVDVATLNSFSFRVVVMMVMAFSGNAITRARPVILYAPKVIGVTPQIPVIRATYSPGGCRCYGQEEHGQYESARAKNSAHRGPIPGWLGRPTYIPRVSR